MFTIRCPACGARSLVGPDAIVSLDNTPDGPVAVVACPSGHLVAHAFRSGTDRALAGAPRRP